MRAGQIIADAEKASQLPPKKIALACLESKRCCPTATELTALYDIHQLAIAMETWFTNYDPDEYYDCYFGDEAPRDYTSRRPAIHRAIYRGFIASSSLARIYLEPLTEATESSDTEIQSILSASPLSDRQREFLDNFPAYTERTSARENHEMFGQLGDWLLGNILSQTALRREVERSFSLGIGYAQGCNERNKQDLDEDLYDFPWDCPTHCPAKLIGDDYTHADAHFVSLELIRMFWVCCKMRHMVGRSERDPDHSTETGIYGPLAPFGWFGAARMAFSMPTVVDKDERPVPTMYTSAYAEESKYNMLGYGLWYRLFDYPNEYEIDGDGVYFAPLLLKFFSYFLQRHLQSAFKLDFFQLDWGREVFSDWESFTSNLEIFAEDSGQDANCYYPSPYDFREADFLDGTDVLTTWDQVRNVRRRLGLHVEDDADEI